MRLSLIGLFALITLILTRPACAQSYSITNVGTLPGFTNSHARAINYQGAVAGFARNGDADAPRPFTYTTGDGIQEVGAAALNGQALGIDGSGNVAGYFVNGSNEQQAFLFRNATVVNLGTLGGTEAAALGLSASGVAPGWARTASGARHAARFRVDGENNALPPFDLGTLGGAESIAHGLNLFGDVVGQAQNVAGQFRPFIYRGAIAEIPTLGGTEGVALAVNNSTYVVGASRTAGNAALHAFVWHPFQGATDLGTLGGTESVATAINNDGLVVGYSRLATGSEPHAFVWHSGTGMVDLNNLLPPGSGWELLEAHGVNDVGQIVGVGRIEGVQRGFVLTPPVADCSISLVAGPASLSRNQNVTLQLEITNGGPNGAPLNRVNQTLPAGWQIVSVEMSQGTHTVSGSDIVFNFGGLANGASATATVVVQATTAGQHTIPAVLRSGKTDENLNNNVAFASVNVEEAATSANLEVEFSSHPQPAGRNADLTYTFAVTNHGPDPAVGVIFSLGMHVDVEFRSASVSQGTIEFTEGGPPADPNFPDPLDYALGALGILESGQTVTGTVVVRYPNNGSFRYFVSTYAVNTDDPDTTDNAVSDFTDVVTAPNASLSLSAQDSPDPLRLGQNLTYTFTVTGQGPATATDTRLVVDVPAGATLVSRSAPQGTSSVVNGDVVFDLGSVANGASVQATVVVTPASAGTLPYSATVTSFGVDADTSNNTQSGTTLVAPFVNLGLTASDGPDPVGVGSDLTYTFDVNNTGPDAATNTRLDVDLPAGAQIVSANAAQGSAMVVSGDVVFTLGTVANGATVRATVVARLQAEGQAAYSATVSSDGLDTSMANNTRNGTTDAKLRADVGLTATDGPDPVLVNQNLTYTFNVSNGGPHTARNVRLSVDLAAGVQIVSRTTPQGSSAVMNGDVVFTLGDIANGASVQCTVVITSAQEGSLAYSATVVTDSIDANAANDTRSGSTGVNAMPVVADLGLTAADGPDPVSLGSQLTYTFQVTNAGPDTAKSARLTVDLPAGVQVVSTSTPQGSAAESSGDVVFSFGDIASGAAALTATVVVAPAQTGSLSYAATLESNSTDPSPGNNTASGSTTVNPATLFANLGVTGSFAESPVFVGSTSTGTFIITNAGPDIATNAQFTLDLPAGVDVVSSQTTQGATQVSGGDVIANLGALAASGTATVTVVIRPTQAGAVNYSGAVTTTSTDSTPGNNTVTGSVTAQPIPTADLAVTVTDTPDPIQTGRNLTYTYTITNSGPDATTGVVFEATVPAGVTLLSVDAPLAGASLVDGKVVSNIGTLANGTSTTVTIVVEVNSATSLTSTGTVDGDLEDPNETNNTVTANTTVQVVARPDLTATWTIQPTQKGVKFRRTRMRYTVKGTFTVRNAGTLKTKPSSAWVYLSDDATLDSGDKVIRKLPIGVLVPNRTLKKAVTYVMPLDQSAAGKYLIVVLDATSKNEEVSESNNRVASSPIP